MAGQRFDRLTRSLTTIGSRRRALKALTGGAVGVLIGLRGGRADAARQCLEAGETCESNSHCCGVGVCRQRTDKPSTQGGDPVPVEKECCRPKGTTCNPRGVFTGRNNCCQGLRCAFGAKRGSTCVDGEFPLLPA